MKSMNDNLTQLTAVMTQMPAVMTTAMAASMTALKTVLVGVADGPRSSSSGQLSQTQPQQNRLRTRTGVSFQTRHSVT